MICIFFQSSLFCPRICPRRAYFVREFVRENLSKKASRTKKRPQTRMVVCFHKFDFDLSDIFGQNENQPFFENA